MLDDLVDAIEILKSRIAAHGTDLQANEIRTAFPKLSQPWLADINGKRAPQWPLYRKARYCQGFCSPIEV